MMEVVEDFLYFAPLFACVSPVGPVDPACLQPKDQDRVWGDSLSGKNAWQIVVEEIKLHGQKPPAAILFDASMSRNALTQRVPR